MDLVFIAPGIFKLDIVSVQFFYESFQIVHAQAEMVAPSEYQLFPKLFYQMKGSTAQLEPSVEPVFKGFLHFFEAEDLPIKLSAFFNTLDEDGYVAEFGHDW